MREISYPSEFLEVYGRLCRLVAQDQRADLKENLFRYYQAHGIDPLLALERSLQEKLNQEQEPPPPFFAGTANTSRKLLPLLLVSVVVSGAIAWFFPEVVNPKSVGQFVLFVALALSTLGSLYFFLALRFGFRIRAHLLWDRGQYILSCLMFLLSGLAYIAELLWPFRAKDS